MAKAPRLGRVKTRLGADIGPVQATRFFRTVSSVVVRRLRGDARWQTVLAISPDLARGEPVWPNGVLRIGQGGGDLGARMWRAVQAFPARDVLVVGTDIPGIDAPAIAQALAELRGRSMVIGSAGDGGYWCVGFPARRRDRSPFMDVRWSSGHEMADTERSFAPAAVGYAPELNDVDTGDDFRRHHGVGVRVVGRV